MSRRVFFGLFAFGFAAFVAFAGHAQGAEKKEMKEGVFFVEPKDGAQVMSPVKVVMGLEGDDDQTFGRGGQGDRTSSHYHQRRSHEKRKGDSDGRHPPALRQRANGSISQARSGGL